MTEVGSKDSCGGVTVVSFTATAGTAYRIAVDGNNSTGETSLTWTGPSAPTGPTGEVTAVGGSALGYYTSTCFDFGSGCGSTVVDGPDPTVALPSEGGFETATVASGRAASGPATFFESGPITVTTEGATGLSGHASSSVSIAQDKSGVDPFNFSTVESRCTSNGTSTTAATQLTGGFIYQGNDTGVVLPDAPPPNTEYFGTIDNVGDRFRIVLNEHVVAQASITVTAMHMHLLGPTAHGEMIVGQSHCDVAAPAPNQAPEATDDTYDLGDTGADAPFDVPAPVSWTTTPTPTARR